MSILILDKFAPENLNYSTLPFMRGSGSECELAKKTLGENLRPSGIHHRERRACGIFHVRWLSQLPSWCVQMTGKKS